MADFLVPLKHIHFKPNPNGESNPSFGDVLHVQWISAALDFVMWIRTQRSYVHCKRECRYSWSMGGGWNTRYTIVRLRRKRASSLSCATMPKLHKEEQPHYSTGRFQLWRFIPKRMWSWSSSYALPPWGPSPTSEENTKAMCLLAVDTRRSDQASKTGVLWSSSMPPRNPTSQCGTSTPRNSLTLQMAPTESTATQASSAQNSIPHLHPLFLAAAAAAAANLPSFYSHLIFQPFMMADAIFNHEFVAMLPNSGMRMLIN